MLAMNQNKNDIPPSLLVREYFEVTKIAIFFTFFIYKKYLISIYKNVMPRTMDSFD